MEGSHIRYDNVTVRDIWWKKNRIGVWFSCNFSGFLAIGTYIVTYGVGEKSCCQWCRFSYLWCYCLWCNLVTKSKSSCQWCTLAFGAVTTMSENHILTFEILFWHSNWVGKCYFDIQNRILLFELRETIVFLHSKSYFDIRVESENRNLTFEIIILTLELSRKMLFWYSKSYFDIRSESENRILTFIWLWLLPLVQFSNQKQEFLPMVHSCLWCCNNYVGKSYFDIRNPILTFELSRKMLFWYSKSYFVIRTERDNRIFTFKILFWHSSWVGKS